jgi:hypothetical protein
MGLAVARSGLVRDLLGLANNILWRLPESKNMQSLTH